MYCLIQGIDILGAMANDRFDAVLRNSVIEMKQCRAS